MVQLEVNSDEENSRLVFNILTGYRRLLTMRGFYFKGEAIDNNEANDIERARDLVTV